MIVTVDARLAVVGGTAGGSRRASGRPVCLRAPAGRPGTGPAGCQSRGPPRRERGRSHPLAGAPPRGGRAWRSRFEGEIPPSGASPARVRWRDRSTTCAREATVAPGRLASASCSRRSGSASIRNQPRSLHETSEMCARSAWTRSTSQRRLATTLAPRTGMTSSSRSAWRHSGAGPDQRRQRLEQRMTERRLEVNTGRQHAGRGRGPGRPERARDAAVHHQHLAWKEPVAPHREVGIDDAASIQCDVQRDRVLRERTAPPARVVALDHQDAPEAELLERDSEGICWAVHTPCEKQESSAPSAPVSNRRNAKHPGTVRPERGRASPPGRSIRFRNGGCEPILPRVNGPDGMLVRDHGRAATVHPTVVRLEKQRGRPP